MLLAADLIDDMSSPYVRVLETVNALLGSKVVIAGLSPAINALASSALNRVHFGRSWGNGTPSSSSASDPDVILARANEPDRGGSIHVVDMGRYGIPTGSADPVGVRARRHYCLSKAWTSFSDFLPGAQLALLRDFPSADTVSTPFCRTVPLML
jgi:hypothetical protein